MLNDKKIMMFKSFESQETHAQVVLTHSLSVAHVS